VSFAQERLIETDSGLGNNAYVVDLGDGRARAVDASRDLRRARQTNEDRDSRWPSRPTPTRTRLPVRIAAAWPRRTRHGCGIRQGASSVRAPRPRLPGRGRSRGSHPTGPPQFWPRRRACGMPPARQCSCTGVLTGGSLLVDSAARTDPPGVRHPRAPIRSMRFASRPARSATNVSPATFTAAWPHDDVSHIPGAHRVELPVIPEEADASPAVSYFTTNKGNGS
jgi:hypothetical protein